MYLGSPDAIAEKSEAEKSVLSETGGYDGENKCSDIECIHNMCGLLNCTHS